MKLFLTITLALGGLVALSTVNPADAQYHHHHYHHYYHPEYAYVPEYSVYDYYYPPYVEYVDEYYYEPAPSFSFSFGF